MPLQSGFLLPKYNRVVYQPESSVTVVEPLITTKVLIAPRTGPFVKGETLTLHDYGLHSVEYLGTDGPTRSRIRRDGSNTTCFTYQLSR